MRKILSLLLSCTLLAGIFTSPVSSVKAAQKPNLNYHKLKISVGYAKKLKVTGAKGTITFRSANNSIAAVSAKGKITALKAGKTKIYATTNKNKTLSCNVKVVKKNAKPGTYANPYSAYKKQTIPFYDGSKKVGTFQIKLNSFLSGSKAYSKLSDGSVNLKPTDTQEYIIFYFQIKYKSGKDLTKAKTVFNYYKNIFDPDTLESLVNVDWGFLTEPGLYEDLSDVNLSPNTSRSCYKAILVEKGHTPVLYRIKTGKGEDQYTWFTTGK